MFGRVTSDERSVAVVLVVGRGGCKQEACAALQLGAEGSWTEIQVSRHGGGVETGAGERRVRSGPNSRQLPALLP